MLIYFIPDQLKLSLKDPPEEIDFGIAVIYIYVTLSWYITSCIHKCAYPYIPYTMLGLLPKVS